MKKSKQLTFMGVVLLMTIFTGCESGSSMPVMSINTPDDIQYAQLLWQEMESEHIVGPGAIKTKPFFGGASPHGMILEVTSQQLALNHHTGFLVTKKNYSGDGVSVDAVEADRAKYLSSITVMYQREAGYDLDNQNWFWVKYRPDGSLFKKDFQGQALMLAGKLIKTKDNRTFGCIYCHSSAGDGDYIFYPDIKNSAFNYSLPLN